ncbi:ExeA2 [Desulfosarcina cetonica]|uniref:AAA family ATPase n=1 Tax=Desulfosarcina cetonica TaxID=90730 RepID=UPI0006D2C782|nr:AAA family ATPase [Desulfosarcina cetonica]VTR64214.1 ExeA2 [Desulfosarcina cetonica]
MYLDFYKLRIKPFQISTDPKFLWLGEKHKEALAVLKYGILDNKGFLLLTGDVGTGKTTLLNALIQSLDENVLVAMVTDPGLAKMDFFNFVADSFEMDKSFKSKGDFLIYLRNYLFDLHGQNKQALLIIDEAQHLSPKMLEEVRLLSNIEKHNTKLINIFFVGQSEFNEIILRPKNRAIRQRITINYNIASLSESETSDYIRFRLGVAGSDNALFTPRAIKEIFRFSNGYPRLINIICDQALLTGYVKEKTKIDEKIVIECAEELKIPHGFSIDKNSATPEAAETVEHRSDKPAVPLNSAPHVNAHDQPPPTRSFSRPLLIVLLALMVFWIGLVSVYLFSQKSTTVRPVIVESPPLTQGDEDQPTATTDQNRIAQQRQSPSNPSSLNKENNQDARVAPDDTPASAAVPADTKPVEKTEPPVELSQIKQTYGDNPTVYFGFNSNDLEPEAYPLLQMVARFCAQNPQVTLTLKGYSDSSGALSYNLKLSDFRANMVKSYLVGRGVKATQIKTLALGPDEASTDGKQRKVVIEIGALQ